MPIALDIKGPDSREKRVEFDLDKVTIGSNPRCDVAVTDPGVDAEQCVLVRRDGRFEVIDIGERGGVLVNGKPVGQAEVQPGDEIWIGGTVMRLASDSEQGVTFTESVSTVRAEVPAAEKAPAPALGAPAPPKDGRFAMLNQVQRLIESIGTHENIFEKILDVLFDSVPARRGFIALAEDGGELQVKAHRSRERGKGEVDKIEVSRTLVGQVLETGRAVLTSDAEADPSFSAAQSIHRLRIKAAICVPLVVENQVIGLIYGDNREQPGSLTKDHLSILTALASVAAVAVEKFRLMDEYDQKLKIEQALAIARSIQLAFLPSKPPAVEGLDVWGVSDSCDETGGDYYDFFPMPDGSLRVAIADVTGHGVGPALLMATGRAALRVLINSEPNLEKLLGQLNNLIEEDVRDGRFITLFMGSIDPKEMRFRNIGAGHTPPIWYRARDASTHLITCSGPPLGILKDFRFQCGTDLPVGKGDVLLFTTDGIIEADRADGEQFGLDRLRELVTQKAPGTARELVESVVEAVDRFTDHRPLRDDATLVAVKLL